MTAVTYLTRHRRPGIVILCSIVAVLSMLFVLPPAIASAADSGAQAVDECNPTASNGCVNGILQDADKKPIADVTITLSGKATAETKTAADGKWAFSVADDGDYTVTIDASVAKEHGLKASSATVTIRKASFDKQRGVVRFDQAGDSTGSGTSGTQSGGLSNAAAGINSIGLRGLGQIALGLLAVGALETDRCAHVILRIFCWGVGDAVYRKYVSRATAADRLRRNVSMSRAG